MASDDGAAAGSGGDFGEELRGIRTLHGRLAARMTKTADDLMACPAATWTAADVALMPYQALAARFGPDAACGIFDFGGRDGGGAIVYVSREGATALAGDAPEVGDRRPIARWMGYLAMQFAAAWQPVRHFAPTVVAGQLAPTVAELAEHLPGLADDTALVVTTFFVELPGRAQPLTLVLGLPRTLVAPDGDALRDLAKPAEGTPVVADWDTGGPDPEEDLKNPETVMKMIGVPPITLELGLDLVPLVDPALGGDLMDLVVPMRVELALDTGFIMPGVQFKDNMHLPGNAYQIRVRGTVVAWGEALIGHKLAITPAGPAAPDVEPLIGFPTTDPVTGRPALWVAGSEALRAHRLGWSMALPSEVVIAHLAAAARAHAHEILSLEEVQIMVNKVRERAPSAAGAVPEVIPLGGLHRTLQHLLRDHMSIRDLPGILEQAASFALPDQEPDVLAARIRAVRAREVVAPLADRGTVLAIALSPAASRRLGWIHVVDDGGPYLDFAPWQARALVAALRAAHARTGASVPVIVCAAAVRAPLQAFLDQVWPAARVITAREVVRPYVLAVPETVGWPGAWSRLAAWWAGGAVAVTTIPAVAPAPPNARVWGEAPRAPKPVVASDDFDFLTRSAPEVVAEALSWEPPATAAGVLACLDPGFADLVLSEMRPGQQEDLIERLQKGATLAAFQRREVAAALRRRLGVRD